MAKLNKEMAQRVIDTAALAGSPPDQIKRFIGLSYIPLPWQWEFHSQARLADNDNGPVDIGLGGARGPGKSHAVLSQAGLDDCQRIKGLKGLFLRQTGIAAKESFDDLVNKVLRGRVTYVRSSNILKFEGGSKIILGGFKDQRDIDKYVGIEYDFIIVEELNQLTEDKYTKLRGSLRTSKRNWRPRMYTSFNPGGIGHTFVKKRYIIPNREGTEKETRFIGSNYTSNPYLNKEYTEYLEGLTGTLGRAWREGEWDLFAGQAFDELDSIHIVKPFRLPDNTRYLAGYDYGYAHPFAFILGAITPDKKVYIIDYLWKNKKRPDEQAKMIVDKLDQLGIGHIYIHAGTDVWANREGRATIHEQLRTALGKKATLVKAHTNIIQGVAEIRKVIAWRNTKTGEPILRFFENTMPVFEQLRDMQVDEKNPEKIVKVNANEQGEGGDDMADACFIKNTKIRIVGGKKNIQDVVDKDIVFTSKGVKSTSGSFCSGYKKVSILITNRGKIIVATNKHPIKTPDGFFGLDTLRYGDIIETWENHKQSSLTSLLLGDTQSLVECICKDIIILAGTIKKEGLKHCIEKFGRNIMGKFLKGWIFIIKIITTAIIQLRILSLSVGRNILKFTKDRLKNLGKILKKSGRWRLNGTRVRRQNLFTGGLVRRPGKQESLLSINVFNVGQHIKQNILVQQSFARISVSRLIVDRLGLMMWLGFAQAVAMVLRLVSIVRRDFAPEHVCGLIENAGSDFVYNLEVEKDHEYFANDILVHNCRYFCMARLYPNPEPKPELVPGTGAELMRFVKMNKRMNQWGY